MPRQRVPIGDIAQYRRSPRARGCRDVAGAPVPCFIGEQREGDGFFGLGREAGAVMVPTLTAERSERFLQHFDERCVAGSAAGNEEVDGGMFHERLHESIIGGADAVCGQGSGGRNGVCGVAAEWLCVGSRKLGAKAAPNCSRPALFGGFGGRRVVHRSVQDLGTTSLAQLSRRYGQTLCEKLVIEHR